MNFFSSSQSKIDPETGEILRNDDSPSLFPSENTSSQKKLRIKIMITIFILINAFIITFVYFSLKRDIEQLHVQFGALFEGVEESEVRVQTMTQSVEDMSHKIQGILATDEEFASVNFWGDSQTAAHLQSIKYIGYYEVNRQRIAYTKSQLGDRFLTKNEVFNGHWRVKEISSNSLVLVGENDKTYTVLKEEQP